MKNFALEKIYFPSVEREQYKVAHGKNHCLSSHNEGVRVGESEIEVTGPPGFVEKKIAEFLKQPPPAPTTRHTPAPQSAMTEPTSSAKPKSPGQFFNALNPKTDNDKVLTAAYFLERFRGAQNATAGEVRDLIREAKRQPPSNVNDAINQNIRKGFLMTGGDRDNKIAFVVTSDGEAHVEEMMKPGS